MQVKQIALNERKSQFMPLKRVWPEKYNAKNPPSSARNAGSCPRNLLLVGKIMLSRCQGWPYLSVIYNNNNNYLYLNIGNWRNKKLKQQRGFSGSFMACTRCWPKLGRWLLLVAAFVAAPVGYAQEAPGVVEPRPEAVQSAASGQLQFDIPPQALASALSRFGETANLELLYDAALARGLNTQGVSGMTYTPEQALRILLAGTGLTARFGDSGTVTLARAVGEGNVLPGVPLCQDSCRFHFFSILSDRGRQVIRTCQSTVMNSKSRPYVR